MALIEGERQNRAGGRAPDAWKTHNAFKLAWECAAVFGDDSFRRLVQITRAGIVAQTTPEVQHAVRPRTRQRAHVGEAFGETLEVRDDGGHLGLLQHDFRYPDAVGIARAFPRQGFAPVAVVPLE